MSEVFSKELTPAEFARFTEMGLADWGLDETIQHVVVTRDGYACALDAQGSPIRDLAAGNQQAKKAVLRAFFAV